MMKRLTATVVSVALTALVGNGAALNTTYEVGAPQDEVTTSYVSVLTVEEEDEVSATELALADADSDTESIDNTESVDDVTSDAVPAPVKGKPHIEAPAASGVVVASPGIPLGEDTSDIGTAIRREVVNFSPGEAKVIGKFTLLFEHYQVVLIEEEADTAGNSVYRLSGSHHRNGAWTFECTADEIISQSGTPPFLAYDEPVLGPPIAAWDEDGQPHLLDFVFCCNTVNYYRMGNNLYVLGDGWKAAILDKSAYASYVIMPDSFRDMELRCEREGRWLIATANAPEIVDVFGSDLERHVAGIHVELAMPHDILSEFSSMEWGPINWDSFMSEDFHTGYSLYSLHADLANGHSLELVGKTDSLGFASTASWSQSLIDNSMLTGVNECYLLVDGFIRIDVEGDELVATVLEDDLGQSAEGFRVKANDSRKSVSSVFTLSDGKHTATLVMDHALIQAAYAIACAR